MDFSELGCEDGEGGEAGEGGDGGDRSDSVSRNSAV